MMSCLLKSPWCFHNLVQVHLPGAFPFTSVYKRPSCKKLHTSVISLAREPPVTFYDPGGAQEIDFYEVYESGDRKERLRNRNRLRDRKLPESVSTVQVEDNGCVHIVGCDHFSSQSQEDVKLVMERTQPDIAVLESDRYGVEEATELSKNASVSSVQKFSLPMLVFQYIKQGTFGALGYLETIKLIKRYQVLPGGEWRTAYKCAGTIPGCAVHLGDMPADIAAAKIKATNLGWKVIWHLFKHPNLVKASNRSKLEEDVDRFVQKHVRPILIHERDLFLTYNIRTAAQLPKHLKGTTEGPVVVAVVGKDHVPGIMENWNKHIDIEALCRKPRPPLFGSVLKWTIGISAVVAPTWIFYRAFKQRLATNRIEHQSRDR